MAGIQHVALSAIRHFGGHLKAETCSTRHMLDLQAINQNKLSNLTSIKAGRLTSAYLPGAFSSYDYTQNTGLGHQEY